SRRNGRDGFIKATPGELSDCMVIFALSSPRAGRPPHFQQYDRRGFARLGRGSTLREELMCVGISQGCTRRPRGGKQVVADVCRVALECGFPSILRDRILPLSGAVLPMKTASLTGPA